jgi:hypothetical protein
MGSKINAEKLSQTTSSFDLCCLFIHQNIRYKTLPNGILLMSVVVKFHNTQQQNATVLHVHCHTVLLSHVKSCQVLERRHKEVTNKPGVR